MCRFLSGYIHVYFDVRHTNNPHEGHTVPASSFIRITPAMVNAWVLPLSTPGATQNKPLLYYTMSTLQAL